MINITLDFNNFHLQYHFYFNFMTLAHLFYFLLALVFVGQSYSIFIAQDKFESEFFFKNVNNSPIYNLSVTNTWNSGSNIEDTNLHQRRSESFENNNNDIVALASFYDRPEYR